MAAARTPAARGFAKTGQVAAGFTGLDLPKAQPGEVVFFSFQPPAVLRCPMGDGPAQPGGGTGTWDTVTLPGRKAAIQPSGIDLETLAVPVMFDGLVARVSVERQIAALKDMARPPEGSPRGTPGPRVRMIGQVPHLGIDWAITGLDWGEATWHNLRRVVQLVTVNLTEYEAADLVRVTRGGGKAAAGKARGRQYTVKAGDTLARIATRQMGARSSAEIAGCVAALKTANKIRDPRTVRAGRKLTIPHVDLVQAGNVVGRAASGTAGFGS